MIKKAYVNAFACGALVGATSLAIFMAGGLMGMRHQQKYTCDRLARAEQFDAYALVCAGVSDE